MSDWVWSITYKDDHPHDVVLADRSLFGSILDVIGFAAVNACGRSLVWRLRLDGPLWRLGQRLADAADRRTRTVAEVPADAALIAALQRQGLVDDDGVAEDCRRKAEDGTESIETLIEHSSLGTPEAKAIRDSADPEAVRRILQRAKELDAQEGSA